MEFVHRYDTKEDMEIAGFLASQFAYGKISLFKNFLEMLFSRMGQSPGLFISEGHFHVIKGLYYRFQKDTDIILLMESLRAIKKNFGSIGAMLRQFYDGNIQKTLWMARDHLFPGRDDTTFFFPKPSPANPLKRWNLYLRWMVRKDAIDVGLWDFIRPAELIVPLDTHVFKIGRCMGWTKRAAPSYAAAQEITDVLKGYSPEDPLRYDFFLCHKIGIGAGCTGKKGTQCKGVCLLNEI